MSGTNALERRIEQIISSGEGISDRLTNVINELVDSEAYSQLPTVLSRVLGDHIPQQISRTVIIHFSNAIKKISGEPLEEIASFAVTAIKNHLMSFDEADLILREILFDYYISQELFKDAAVILSGINMDSSTNTISDQNKTEIYVKCAEAFLEDDETVDAEVFLNKASSCIQTVTEVSLLLRYRATYARVLDANRKFVEAAMRYYDLSNTTYADVNQEDLLELLGKAVTCAVLGKAGPQRSRVLGLLYKDERIRSLDQIPRFASHASVLTKMYTEQILRREELTAFESSLMPHQKALTSDSYTIPEKAVIEHNMLATGRIYDNITFIELGSILRLDAERAEKVAARMISEDRLKASIDQTEGLLQFSEDSDALRGWDERIKEVCGEVADCVDAIGQSYPQLIVG
mmetsp:Transcript_992/g.1093  ORF Transcript_992/g.1093 Transcript_992/m.1093 type:complete len:405 (+) Transcript_992:155-1369(+)